MALNNWLIIYICGGELLFALVNQRNDYITINEIHQYYSGPQPRLIEGFGNTPLPPFSILYFITTIPCIWFGITTNPSNSTFGLIFFVFNHSSSTILPKSFK